MSTVGLTSVASAHEDSEEESTNGEQGDETTARSASITLTDHTTKGGTVTADRVSMSEGGFVSIHDRRRFEGQVLPSIIGITDFLEPGTHYDVTVPLFTENATAPGPAEGQDQNGLTESQPLIAIPHRDANGSGEFNGEPNPDPAYKGPGALPELGAVNDIATLFVNGADQEERNRAKAEEQQARNQFSGN